MRRLVAGILGGAVLLGAAPAFAQTMNQGAAAPSVETFYGGVFAGTGVVHKWGGTAGVEAGIRVRRNLDLIGEAGWVQNVVTSEREASVQPIVQFLELTQGTSASGKVEAPAIFGTGGLRWVFERNGAWRPYVLATAGVARVEHKTTFALGGTDITGAIETYGVTVGLDLQGQETAMTFGAGTGVLYVGSRWYADAGLRFNSIQLEAGATKMWRAALGVGFRY